MIQGSQFMVLRPRTDIRSGPKKPSPNDLLSKGARVADIEASAKASRKTHVCIVLKQRSNSGYYEKLCYLGKQMAVHQDTFNSVSAA